MNIRAGFKYFLSLTALLIWSTFVWGTSFAQSTPLPGDQAFAFSFHHIDANNLSAQWKIHPQYHLYRSSISFQIPEESGAELGRIIKPSGETMQDAVLGKYEIYRGLLKITVPILGSHAGDVELNVHYQGCSDSGFCYPPQTEHLNLHFDAQRKLDSVSLKIQPNSTTKNLTSIHQTPQQLLASHNYPLIIVSFFIFGLLLSLTPCVLPMFPILSGIIIGHGETITTRKAFLLSLTYVLAMSLTYAILGVFISTLGENLQSLLQQPWIICLTAILFFVLALSMFGLYDIRMPQALEAKLADISRHQRAGHYIGVAIMGVLATLILSPCVTAPLVGVLAFIAMNGDLQLGFIALFVLGLGMGAPLLLVGLSAGKLLPRAGYWMNSIKIIIGFLLLGVCVNLLSRILTGPISLMLWASIVISSAYFLFINIENKNSVIPNLLRGFSISLIIYGTIMLIGASAGNDNPFQPLQNFRAHSSTQSNLTIIPVKNSHDVKLALDNARQQKKPVMLDFYADWCLSCKVIERNTFQNPEVKQLLSKFILLKADITRNDANDIHLKKTYSVFAPPTIIFFDDQSNRLQEFDIVGEVSAAEMVKTLQRILLNEESE